MRKAIEFYDHGDFFADRYRIVFDNGDEYNLSDDANMPNGCCIYAGNSNDIDYNFPVSRGKKIKYSDLPEGTKKQIAYLETL